MLVTKICSCVAINEEKPAEYSRLHGSNSAENYMSNFISFCCHYRGSIGWLQTLVMVAASYFI